jgi:radical SAM superfamily enzyme YgiQ (UPF0313 family)
MAKNDMLLVYPIPTLDSPVNLAPLSILLPGALFESRGLRVAYFDERYDPDALLTELIKDSKEIGVSAFTGPQAGRAADILMRAKALNPAIITGVGGHHARLLPEQVLAEPFVDKVWTEPSYGEDLFPYNARTKNYFARSDMQYFTSRGCPHSCSFCCLHSPWQPKAVEALERELSIIHADIGFTEISFSDPNIAFGRSEEERVGRIRQIGRIMRKLKVRWDGNMRSPYLSPRMVEALAESNCYSLEIGCESGNDAFLRKVIGKGHGVDAIRKAALAVRGSGISVMYSFIAHMPRETEAMLADTFDLIDWIVAQDPDARVSIFTYAPFPGSRMYRDAVEGAGGYPPFVPPTTMKGWAELPFMKSPLYWIAGLCFRKDNTRKNFRGDDWKLIDPYLKLAEKKWTNRDFADFPTREVEELILTQMIKYETVRRSQSRVA